ncbi:MAG: hypothetical protein FWD34_06695 [Oscillospiraceae bacterium]|nr:hypothetical protein [Oscillospiraceae bacterium]
MDYEIIYHSIRDVIASDNIKTLSENVHKLIKLPIRTKGHKDYFSHTLLVSAQNECNRVFGDSMSLFRFNNNEKLKKGKVAYISKQDSAIALFLSYCAWGGDYKTQKEVLIKFLNALNAFIPAVEKRITQKEMREVIRVAQEKLHFMDTIMKGRNLFIASLPFSHEDFNSFAVNPTYLLKSTIVFSLHSKSIDIHDRIFIFAHELGHVFHLAITGSFSVLPEEFHAFNEIIGVGKIEGEEGNEYFADIIATAILHETELSAHLPSDFGDGMCEVFSHFGKAICEKYKF